MEVHLVIMGMQDGKALYCLMPKPINDP